MRLTLAAPRGFSFRHTVLSHGWCALPPFRAAPTGEWLEGVVAVDDARVIRYRLSSQGSRVLVDVPETVEPALRARVRDTARRVLNLDTDLSEFHERARGSAALGWISAEDRGRLLRAPTAWEDLVKLVLTTNCSWAATTGMVGRLVERYGPRARDGSPAFPGPDALARVGQAALRDHVRVGYRAPLLVKLAERVASRGVDLERWEHDERPPRELRREIMELPGVGPYVAENFLKMIGRPAGLALDSWLRVQYARVYHGRRRVSDRTIARRYARFGDWAGLALWCDMVRAWARNGMPPEVARGPAREGEEKA